MSFAIFTSVGMMLILKVLHVGAGIVWLGSSGWALQERSSENVNRWIKWASTITLITGLIHIAGNYSLSFYSSWGVSMLLGSALGLVMWCNLMCVISPAEKAPNKRAEVFSYTNILLSLPMLFFMEMASHLGIEFNSQSARWPLLLSLALPVILIEVYTFVGKGPQVRNLQRSLMGGLSLLIFQYVTLELLSK